MSRYFVKILNLAFYRMFKTFVNLNLIFDIAFAIKVLLLS